MILLPLGGIIFVISLVVVLANWKQPRRRTHGLIALGVSIALMGGVIVYGVWSWARTATTMATDIISVLPKPTISPPKESAIQQYLRQAAPDTLRHQVPGDFYSEFGFRDFYRFPLVYPYAIHCIDLPEAGEVINEREVKHASDWGGHSVNLPEIKGLRLDPTFLLGEVAEPSHPSKAYFIFHWGSQEVTYVADPTTLWSVADSLGYTGPDQLYTLREYWELF